jgi:hypothetical protein
VSSKEQPFKWLLRSETNWLAYESSSTNVAVGVQNWVHLLSAVNQTVVYAYFTNGRFFPPSIGYIRPNIVAGQIVGARSAGQTITLALSRSCDEYSD